MCSTANQVHASNILETIMRPQMQHLPKRMCHREGRTPMQSKLLPPARGSHDSLGPDAALHVRKPDALYLPKRKRAKALRLARPVHLFGLVSHGEQHVKAGTAAWRE